MPIRGDSDIDNPQMAFSRNVSSFKLVVFGYLFDIKKCRLLSLKYPFRGGVVWAKFFGHGMPCPYGFLEYFS
jgi:hypothetical protein